MSGPDALETCALAAVLRWPWERHLEVLVEDSLYGPLGPAELQRRIALRALDLAAGELLAQVATDREGRRRAAEVLTGASILALLSPHGEAHPEALRHLEHARRGLSRDGIAWGGLAELARKAHDVSISPTERAAAGAAWWASHLALGDAPAEAGRMAFAALSAAFAAEHAPAGLAVALAHMERTLADRPIDAAQLRTLAGR